MIAPAALILAEQAALLGIARAALRHRLRLCAPPVFPEEGPLADERGAFVTLRVDGKLRGCVGTFRPVGSLARTVASMSVSAATEDPRFEPIRPQEADAVSYHVSVLGPTRRMRDPSDLEIGLHGLLVRNGWHRGALLPRIAVERNWDRTAFLKHACIKASLPADAWRDPETTVEIFAAEEFGDSPDD